MTSSPTELLAQALAKIDSTTSDAYHQHLPLLIAYTSQPAPSRLDDPDRRYASQAELAALIGAQLRLKSAHALIEAFVGVYRAAQLRGAALRDFPIDLPAWTAAADLYLDPHCAAQIKRLYRGLADLHSWLTLLAHNPPDGAIVDERLAVYIQRYLTALLKPDMVAAIRITGEYVKAADDLVVWWEQIIQPAMYEIGNRWSRGEITVGQEHMATAITQRVMSIYYPLILDLPRYKGNIVVTASPGEMHEIGTRIVADLLEVHGWDVHCTGANTPTTSIIDLVQRTNARFLCISTTLSASLPAVSELIGHVRAADRLAGLRILVGGQAYLAEPDLWRQVGADSFAHTARAGIDYIQANQH